MKQMMKRDETVMDDELLLEEEMDLELADLLADPLK